MKSFYTVISMVTMFMGVMTCMIGTTIALGYGVCLFFIGFKLYIIINPGK